MPLLVVLKRITNDSTTNNFKFEIVEFYLEIGGPTWEELGNKVVTLCVDGFSVFQDLPIGDTIQLKNKDCPFVIGT